MRGILLSLIALFLVFLSFSQNVGIGTTGPLMKLHVLNADSAVVLLENSQTLGTNVSNALYFKTGSTGFPYTGAIKTIGQSFSQARIGFFTYADASPNGLRERLSITDAGNVGIGTTTPANGYLLSVKGKAICEELKVQLNANWPDYVFNSDYKLLPLAELEKLIIKNKHLPNIPSADCITADKGFELGEMNRKLLEKVEELTLYIIDLNKKNIQLAQEIEAVKAHLKTGMK